ncbi:MAG: hypothetical protein OXG39_08330 [Chloroflexi bacterium]|nr:hypothetical protein [Chloroflexota bacterium]
MAIQAATEQAQIESNQAGRSSSERITAIEATLPRLATKADLERHTRLRIMWLAGAQFARFAALSALLLHFLG